MPGERRATGRVATGTCARICARRIDESSTQSTRFWVRELAARVTARGAPRRPCRCGSVTAVRRPTTRGCRARRSRGKRASAASRRAPRSTSRGALTTDEVVVALVFHRDRHRGAIPRERIQVRTRSRADPKCSLRVEGLRADIPRAAGVDGAASRGAMEPSHQASIHDLDRPARRGKAPLGGLTAAPIEQLAPSREWPFRASRKPIRAPVSTRAFDLSASR